MKNIFSCKISKIKAKPGNLRVTQTAAGFRKGLQPKW